MKTRSNKTPPTNLQPSAAEGGGRRKNLQTLGERKELGKKELESVVGGRGNEGRNNQKKTRPKAEHKRTEPLIFGATMWSGSPTPPWLRIWG